MIVQYFVIIINRPYLIINVYKDADILFEYSSFEYIEILY